MTPARALVPPSLVSLRSLAGGVAALLLLLAAAGDGLAAPGRAEQQQQQQEKQQHGVYVVELRGMPLATYRGHILGYPATAPRHEGPHLHASSRTHAPPLRQPLPPTSPPPVPPGELIGTPWGHSWGRRRANGSRGGVGRMERREGGGVGGVTDATTETPAAARDQRSPRPSSQPSQSKPTTFNHFASQQQQQQRRPRLDVRAVHVVAVRAMLQRQQQQVAADVGLPPSALLHHLHAVSHAFTALLSPTHLWRLKRHPAVAAVTRSRLFRAPPRRTLFGAAATSGDTSAVAVTRGDTSAVDVTTFLGLPASMWQAAGGQSNAGADVVVGIVGSGIWPEHPAFDASAFSGVPPGWQGVCDGTADFSCNAKVVGGRRLYGGYQKLTGSSPDFSFDYDSLRDVDGRGTWCAGAAAGNKVTWASGGSSSGVAPAARVAAYKVVWNGYSTDADVLAAVDAAVMDGVDVLSFSVGAVGATMATYFTDTAFLHANAAGVVVVFPSGDSGEPNFWRILGGYVRTIDNFSPFYLTVGASTIEGGGAGFGAAAVVPAGGAKAGGGSSGSASNTTSPASAVPQAAGSVAAAAPSVPAVWPTSSSGPLVWRVYRCRPPYPTNSLLKPDLIAPAVNLFSAAPATTIGAPGGRNNLTGSAMAAPLVAGIAAMVVQQHPLWSPAQVMSALMTSARTRNLNGGPIQYGGGKAATAWQMGCGHVFPPGVLDPGLTYDAGEAHYRDFLAGQSLQRARKRFPGAKLKRLAPRNLNRASIALCRAKGTTRILRTVTSVGASSSTYKATVVSPWGVAVSVKPKRFTIAAGQSVTFTVWVRVTVKSWDFHYGSLTWRDELGHVVRSPIVVQPLRYVKWCIGCRKTGIIAPPQSGLHLNATPVLVSP